MTNLDLDAIEQRCLRMPYARDGRAESLFIEEMKRDVPLLTAEIRDLEKHLAHYDGFASDAVEDVDYWRLKARDHWDSYKGCADENRELKSEIEQLRLKLNTPHTASFLDGVRLEAAHQRERWGAEHDAGKTDADWFWLVGYLAGKALTAAGTGNFDKALHHTISTAAALLNWHAALSGSDSSMRPGISEQARGGL